MIKNLLALLFCILLFLPLAHAQGKVNLNTISPQKDVGFAIYQFDIFRCYQYGKSRYSGDLPLEPIRFNETINNFWLNILKEKFKNPGKYDQLIVQEDKIYNYSYGFDYFVKNQYGDSLGFSTDGYWWRIYIIKDNISLSNYSLLSEYYSRFLQTSDYMKIFIPNFYEKLFWNISKMSVDCEMETERYKFYFSPFNFFVKDYFDDLGCTYSNDSLLADCENSEIFQLIPEDSELLQRRFRPKYESYKEFNSFILLNRADIIKADRDYDFDILGKPLIISEYPIYKARGGHGSYLDMLEYFKNLKDIELKRKKIDKLKAELISKTENLTNTLSKISAIANSEKSVKEKQKELARLKKDSYDFSNLVRHEMNELNTDFISKERFYDREKETFYGLFYKRITEDYLSNYEGSLNEIKSNLDYYHDNLRYLYSYATQLNLDLQFQIDSEKQREENAQSLLVTSALALFAVFSSILFFFIENIIKKYGYRTFILYIDSFPFKILTIMIATLAIIKFFFKIPRNTYFLINFTILFSFLIYYTVIYWHDSKFVRDQCIKQLKKSNKNKKEKQTAFEILMNLLISSYQSKELETYNLYLKEITNLFKNPPKQIKNYLNEFMAKIFSYYGAILPKQDIKNLLELLKNHKILQVKKDLHTKLKEEGFKPKMVEFRGYYE